MGVSPRATIALDRCARAHAWLAGRDYVTTTRCSSDGIPQGHYATACFCSYHAQAEGITANQAIAHLISLAGSAAGYATNNQLPNHSDGVTLNLDESVAIQHSLFAGCSVKAFGHKFNGQHESNRKGRGMNFSEVRQYQAGDDIRSIDWRVTARTGKAHTKLFSEEREQLRILS